MKILSEYGGWIILGLLLFALFFLVRNKLKEKSVWAQMVKKYRDAVNEKLGLESAFVARYGSIENKSLFYKLDRLILLSGIRRFVPWLSGEAYLFVVIVAVAIGIVGGVMLTGNGFIALFVGAIVFVVLYVILLGLSGKTYNQIEDSTSIFVSILSNHAKGSSDIVTIMQSTMYSMEGPIRDLIERFVMDAEKTGNVDLAFDYMKESVDNRQLQTIIMNLKNCMHYQANYEEVLGQMMSQIAASLSAREERKNILFSMKLTLIVISIASALIVLFIGKGIDVDVKEILTGNMLGQAILFITGVLYLFVVVKLFGTDK